MSRGAKFLIRYRLRANLILLGLAIGIYFVMALVFNAGTIFQGRLTAAGAASSLAGLTATITIVGIIALFIMPRRTFTIANQFGISRTTLWWTGLFTPVFWTLWAWLAVIVTNLVSGDSLSSELWIALAIYLASFFPVQALADCVALVHGFWKVVVIIGIPSLSMAGLIWGLTLFGRWMDRLGVNFNLSHQQALHVLHILQSPGLWLSVLAVWLLIMICFSWLFTRLIQVQRD